MNCSKRIKFTPQGRIGRFFDYLFMPVMYWLQGNWSELPQRTHFWNNKKLSTTEISLLDESKMAVCESEKNTIAKRWIWGIIPIFHMPRFGGWKTYIHIELSDHDSEEDWFIGWVCEDGTVGLSLVPIKNVLYTAYSNVPIRGGIRVLIGPDKVSFFGLNASGGQVCIQGVHRGEIGKGDVLTRITPLL